MLIFVVHYRESERNEFECWRPDSRETAVEFVDTPLKDHACGYLLTQGNATWDLNGVPKLQRRAFCGSDKVEDFVKKVEAEAKPLTSADVLRLHDERRDYINRIRKEAKMAAKEAKAPKEPKAKKEKAPKETNGEARERAARFAPNPKAKITKLVDANPRKEGSKAHKSFALIRNGMTVEKYVEAGGKLPNLKKEVSKGRVKLEEPAA